jgi:two-component system sensor histidine kinase KdpD
MKQIKRRWSNAARYGISILIVGVATLIGLPFHSSIEPANLVMLYLAAVVIIAVYLGRGPSILASLLGVLIFDFIFVEPRLSFSVYDTQYLITFAGLLVVGLIISGSAAQLRDRMEKLRQREAQTAALNSLSRELTGAAGMAEVLSAVNQHVHRSLESEAAIFLGHENELKQEAITPGLVLSDADRSMVHTVFATSLLPAALWGFYWWSTCPSRQISASLPKALPTSPRWQWNGSILPLKTARWKS